MERVLGRSLHGGPAAGLPLEDGWVIDDHVAYVLVLFGLGAFGAGRILGLDRVIEEIVVVERHPSPKYVLG